MLNKRSITVVIIVVLLIALGFTATAAITYWNDVVKLQRVTIPLGGSEDAELLVLDVSESFDGKLVPQGKVYWEGEQDEVVFKYNLSIDKALAQTMNLEVRASSILIGGSDYYAGLVQIEINGQLGVGVMDFFNDVVEVVVVVRLLEPVDQDEINNGLVFDETKHYLVEDSLATFNAIKGQTIDLTLRFEVLPKS